MNETCTLTFPTVGKLETDVPSDDWTDEELGEYAKYHDEQCEIAGRKMAVHRFHQGHALTLAYNRVMANDGYGNSGAYLKKHGISTSGDDRARRLYEAAGTEEAVLGMTIMEAYRKHGVEKPKRSKAVRAEDADKPSPGGDPLVEPNDEAVVAEADQQDELAALQAAHEEAMKEFMAANAQHSQAGEEDRMACAKTLQAAIGRVQQRDKEIEPAEAKLERKAKAKAHGDRLAGLARCLYEASASLEEAKEIIGRLKLK